MQKVGALDLKEPFKGLFTQGMVTHETYRLGGSGTDGRWVSPAEIKIDEADGNRRAILLETGEEVTIGSIEKMSKSKKNTVHPTDILESYGADTARWFVLSDSPPERDVIWTEEGVQGSWRFVQRTWRLIQEIAEKTSEKSIDTVPEMGKEALQMRRTTHKTLAAVSKDIEALGFNRAVARIYEFVNQTSKAANDGWNELGMNYAIREAGETLTHLLAPMMPHLAEECWSQLTGGKELISQANWPEVDESLLVEDTVTMPVQINGKRRGEIVVARDASKETVERAALDSEFVKRALDGKAPRKLIVVPQRIVNVVA